MDNKIRFEDQQGTGIFECIMCDEWNYKRGAIKIIKKHVYMTRAELEGLGSCWTEHREESRRRIDHAYDDAERTRRSEEHYENMNPGNGQHLQDSEIAMLDVDENREYWRPSCMFKWLRASGGDMTNVYKAFEHHKGKESYVKMGLEPPIPMEQDIEHADEWSHTSDYDEMGFSPTNGIAADAIDHATSQRTIDKSRRHEHREHSRIRMTNVYDGIEDARECDWKNEESVIVVKRLEVKAPQIKKRLRAMAGTVACFSRDNGKQNFKSGQR